MWGDLCSGTTYMTEGPTNPDPKDDGSCGDVPYTYTADAGGGTRLSYHIDWCLSAATGGVASGNHNATPAGLEDD